MTKLCGNDTVSLNSLASTFCELFFYTLRKYRWIFNYTEESIVVFYKTELGT